MLLTIIGLIALAVTVLIALKIAKKPTWGVLAIFFLLPFERIPTVEVAGFTLKLNHMVGGMVIILWFIQLLKDKPSVKNSNIKTPNSKQIPNSNHQIPSNLKFVSHPTNPFVWLLIVGLVLSFTQAVDPSRSVIFFIQAVFVLALYGVIVDRVNDETVVEKITQVILASTWLVVLFALYQFVGDYLNLPTGLDQGYTNKVLGFPRVQAFSKEPLYLANFLFIPLGLLIGYLVQENKPFPRHGVVLLPLIILVFLLTVSRGAYLGLLAFGVLAIIVFGRQLLRSRAFQMASLALTLAVLAVITIVSLLGPQASQRFLVQATIRDVELSPESIFGRLRAFSQAIEVWQTSPITGVGLGGFGPATGEEISTGYPIVNNQYLELLAESGVVGLVVFVAVIMSILVVFIKIWITIQGVEFIEAMLGGLMAALIATLVQYNFFSTLAIIHIWLLIGLVVAVQSIILRKFNG